MKRDARHYATWQWTNAVTTTKKKREKNLFCRTFQKYIYMWCSSAQAVSRTTSEIIYKSKRWRARDRNFLKKIGKSREQRRLANGIFSAYFDGCEMHNRINLYRMTYSYAFANSHAADSRTQCCDCIQFFCSFVCFRYFHQMKWQRRRTEQTDRRRISLCFPLTVVKILTGTAAHTHTHTCMNNQLIEGEKFQSFQE